MTLSIVAELGPNHLGSEKRARELVLAAYSAGATHVKFQAWKPGTMCVDPTYVIQSGPWKGRGLQELYRECHTPWEWFPKLFEIARKLGMVPFASAFDCESVDFLETFHVELHKVASFELCDIPLLRKIRSTGKPVLLSTGAATECEIRKAASMFSTATLLHCVSEYPSRAEDANLKTMVDMRNIFGYRAKVGLSDHSQGIGVAVAAVALGACVIEKHLTIRRADGGPDAGFSLEPREFAHLVHACRQAAVAYGKLNYVKNPSPLRRSLWIAQEGRQGEQITDRHVCTARPALGLPCGDYDGVMGRFFARDVRVGEPLTRELVV